MEKFGPAFRKIRQAKNITIKQAAGSTVTPSFLSKFERGASEISFTNLLTISDKLNIDINELLLEAHHLEPHPQAQFLTNLATAVKHQNILGLQNSEGHEQDQYERDQNVRHLHNQALCRLYQARIQSQIPNPADWHLIRDYLMNVEEWSYYEFLLYANSLYFLPTEIIHLLSRQLYQKGTRYLTLTENKAGLVESLLNTIQVLIERQALDHLTNYFKLCEPLLDSVELLFERFRLQFYQGAFQYLTGHHKAGLATMDAVLSGLKSVSKQEAISKEFETLKQTITKSAG